MFTNNIERSGTAGDDSAAGQGLVLNGACQGLHGGTGSEACDGERFQAARQVPDLASVPSPSLTVLDAFHARTGVEFVA